MGLEETRWLLERVSLPEDGIWDAQRKCTANQDWGTAPSEHTSSFASLPLVLK